MLPTKDTIKHYFIYQYTFLDDLSFIKNPYEFFEFEDKEKIDDAINLMKERFLQYGWEGDGEIGIIWLPPFVDAGVGDTWGTYIWHVKQRNNGISFIACDYPLRFKRIKEQNEANEIERHKLKPISIIYLQVDWFIKSVDNVEVEIKESLAYISKDEGLPTVQMIKQSLNTHYQGLLVRYFQEFMDECYLAFLVEAIRDGNPHKIKLRKSHVKLDAASYIPEIDLEDTEDKLDNGGTYKWFTLIGLIGDMWRAYKWEPFKSKVEMLFKSIDYNIDDLIMREIKKHVILRNCLEHHEGSLDRDSLAQLGLKRIEMKGAEGPYYIEVWKPIIISEYEIYAFCNTLKKFVDDFHNYVTKRVPTIHYMSIKK